MMKRMFILLVLISLILIPAMAADGDSLSSDEFEIKGYKIIPSDSDSVEFVITDAISEYLNTFQSADLEDGESVISKSEIDATSQIESFLASEANFRSGEDVENIIFSYRLVARGSNKYRITFTMTPFKKDGDDYGIDASFKTAHHNVVYTDGNTDGSQASDKIKINHATTYSSTNSDTDPEGNATLSGTVVPDSSVTRQWICRGAVLMAVSQSDFDKADTGKYVSTVNAKLEVL